MKISQKALACNLSPMRKFHPFAVAATNNGKKIYHLNIGQPDIATPPAYFEAVRNFELPVLEYAPSPGLPVLIKAVQDYYDKLGIHYEESDILITTGGSEALQCFSPFPFRFFRYLSFSFNSPFLRPFLRPMRFRARAEASSFRARAVRRSNTTNRFAPPFR